METNVATKGKGRQAKKKISVRQQKKEALKHNIHAATDAIATYSKKTTL